MVGFKLNFVSCEGVGCIFLCIFILLCELNELNIKCIEV